MDTISIKVNLNLFSIIQMEGKENEMNSIINKVKNDIENFESRWGYTFLKVTNFQVGQGFTLKVSYPKYFAGTNAYLISGSEECIEVQQVITSFFSNHPYLKSVSSLELIRVDIPFTFLMEENQQFYQYANIYKILAYVYTNKGYYSKAIIETTTDYHETIIYSSTPIISDFHSKVQIYNQLLNVKVKTERDYKNISQVRFNQINSYFPDLPRRIRIEVSKKIKRDSFPLTQFGEFDIFKTYLNDYKEYLINNMFDFFVIDSFYETWAEDLAKQLISARANGGVNYKNYLLTNLAMIYDYELVRRAICKTTDSISTREKAITQVRRFLKEREEAGYLFMNNYKTIKKMRDAIVRSFIF